MSRSMDSRTRVRGAAAHEETDRIPLDYWSREDVTARLCAFLGLADAETLYRRLGIDIRHVAIDEHHEAFDDRVNCTLGGFSECAGGRFIMHGDGSFEDAWGIVRRLGADQLYDQWVSGPFAASTDLDSFPWAGGDIYDPVEVVRERAALHGGRFALLGSLNLPFKMAWHMRGLENFLCDMVLDPPFARELLQRIAIYELQKGIRFIRAGVDVVGIYGDIAMQDRMLVSLPAWRALEKPILASMISNFREENPDILVLFHSDGNTMEVLPDLIEIGVDIVNPIQPECMDPALVKRMFGKRITMHGTISIQRTLPFGSVEEVRREVRERIRTCGQGGGLILCPSNLLQNDIPLQNIIALYDLVLEECEPAG
jgi:uroporphyrinogen decarboxylase